FPNGLENDWDGTMYETLQGIQAADLPCGLQGLELVYTEGAWGEDAVRVLREYAASGEYDVILDNGGAMDNTRPFYQEFPEIMFVIVGTNPSEMVTGGNLYFIDKRLHEANYLQGIIAGMMTETGVIGAVGPLSIDVTNAEINAFIEGARSVNPDVKVKVSWIDSWYDPPKANEATTAMIAAGADQIFMRSDGFEACEEGGIACYGATTDNSYLAPNSVVADSIANWTPEVVWFINQWCEAKTSGEPFSSPDLMYWAGYADGGVSLSDYYQGVPQEVSNKVDELVAGFMDGSFEVVPNYSVPVSD
ncbi:MAG: hypothetical protein A2Z14_14775, partial [Chloroflexi bacterium RBG_16_48_8]